MLCTIRKQEPQSHSDIFRQKVAETIYRTYVEEIFTKFSLSQSENLSTETLLEEMKRVFLKI